MSELHGVVLAAGISSRMGFPKALIPIGSSFFLLTVYEKLVSAGVSPVHIVINKGLRGSLDAQVARFPEADFVLNQEPALGQIHSLELGLKAAGAGGAKAAVVTLVDMAFVQAETVQLLVDAVDVSPEKIIVPRSDGKHGHPMIVPASRFADFSGLPAGKSARDVLHEHADWIEYVDVADQNILLDVDTPEDLAKAMAGLRR
jgi:molybdenum cofactor cytidylyltransferase